MGGLERALVDGDGHIASCIDGDLTAIEGPDCWQDPRMADGLSLTTAFTALSAAFAGREPGWEGMVIVRGEPPCDEPPEQSLWDPR